MTKLGVMCSRPTTLRDIQSTANIPLIGAIISLSRSQKTKIEKKSGKDDSQHAKIRITVCFNHFISELILKENQNDLSKGYLNPTFIAVPFVTECRTSLSVL